MPDSTQPSANTSTNPPTLPLRLKDPQFEADEWPCSADRLGRHKEIENLTPVLLNAEAPLVFAIDAPWGGGKTTFIRLWQHYLNKEEKVSLYLNAWESDFAEDPLLPMLAVLDDWLSTFDPESAIGKLWSQTKKFAPGLVRTGLSTSAKVLTLGTVDAEAAIERVLADAAGGITGDIVDNFKSKHSALKQFKEQLNKVLAALPEDQQNLIIFVDELDRCKPTYAIEVLERIKHLFDIDRLVFVLAVNRDQLSKSLQGVYGPSFDGMHYLKRFIDLDYQLKVMNRKSYISAKLEQSDLTTYFESRRSGGDALDTIRTLLHWLSERFSYTLRDIDQIIMRFRLIVRSIPHNHQLDPVILICLLILRQQNDDLYLRFVNDVRYVDKVIEFFLGGKFEDVVLPESFGWIAGWLIRSGYDCYRDTDIEALIEPWQQLLEQLDENDDRRNDIRRLLSVAGDQQGLWDRSNIRRLAHDRIELVHKIDISA